MDKKLKLFTSPMLCAGLFFLINPTVALFDVLPDFIGYMLIYASVSELARLDDRLSLASQKLLYLSGLSFVRFVVAFCTVGYNSSTIMTLCFAFGVAECVLIVTLLGDFFGGFDYLLQRFGGFEALSGQGNISFITSFFFCSKIVLGFLPEIAAIFELRAYYDIDKSTLWRDIASYRPYAVLLFAVIITAFGIYWYASAVRYFRSMRRDEAFMTNMASHYSETFGDGQADRAAKSLKAATVFVCAGFVFLADISVDRYPLLPTCVGTVLLFAACMLVRGKKESDLVKWAVPAFAVQLFTEYFAASQVSFNVMKMAEVPLWLTLTLIPLCLAYAALSVIFLLKVEKSLSLSAAGSEDKELYGKYLRVNIAYYIYLNAYLLSFILPVIQTNLAAVKNVSMIVFAALAIRLWIKTESAYGDDN